MKIKTRPRHSGKRFLLIQNPVISGAGWIPSTGYRIESGMTARYDDIKLMGQQSPVILNDE